jgi:hypothetical protein
VPIVSNVSIVMLAGSTSKPNFSWIVVTSSMTAIESSSGRRQAISSISAGVGNRAGASGGGVDGFGDVTISSPDISIRRRVCTPFDVRYRTYTKPIACGHERRPPEIRVPAQQRQALLQLACDTGLTVPGLVRLATQRPLDDRASLLRGSNHQHEGIPA